MSEAFDVVIIGSGIAGLVCGNYLSKAGLKVLLLEQHYLPGGCCSSFQRNAFTFDSGAHSLGSCREGGQFNRVLRELELSEKIDIKRARSSDSVVAHGIRVNMQGSLEADINEFSGIFNKDREGIRGLFEIIDRFDINSPDIVSGYYRKYSSITFRTLLNTHLVDEVAKSLLCAFLGNSGLSSFQISALAAIAMFKEFVFDGGYFVVGGMGQFTNFLAESFRERGGILQYKQKVRRIVVSRGNVEAVIVDGDRLIKTSCVVSNAGLRETFHNLIGIDQLPTKLRDRISTSLPSISAFVVYLGVRGKDLVDTSLGRTVWYTPEGDVDEIYGETFEGKLDTQARTLLCAFPSRFDPSLAPEGYSTIYLFMVAPFLTDSFWKEAKDDMMSALIGRAEGLVPNLRRKIEFSEAATPHTLYRYTLNDAGAMYGLASIPSQIRPNIMPQQSRIHGLFLASHWVTVGAGQGGTPMAAFAGRNAAQLILKNRKILSKQTLIST